MSLSLRPQSFLLGVNVVITLTLLYFMFISPGILRTRTYTYIGDDYPIELPLPKDITFVAMTSHETVHYDLNLTDPIATDEWGSLMLYPRGYGRIHLSPERRVFGPVFWHQLHCIRELSRGIQDRNHPISTRHHIMHCLNYMRQTILCTADHTLEVGDFMKRDFEMDRNAGTKMCKDWERIEGLMQRKILDFLAWLHRNDL